MSLYFYQFLNKHLLYMPHMSHTPYFMQASGGDSWKSASSIYEFKVNDIDGNEVSLEKYK